MVRRWLPVHRRLQRRLHVAIATPPERDVVIASLRCMHWAPTPPTLELHNCLLQHADGPLSLLVLFLQQLHFGLELFVFGRKLLMLTLGTLCPVRLLRERLLELLLKRLFAVNR